MKILFLFISVILIASCKQEQVQQRQEKPDTLRFFVIGDWGRDGTNNQKILADAMDDLAARHGLDFILSTGDNLYPEGVSTVDDPKWETSFENIYTGNNLKAPWYVALGNHDYLKDPKAEIAYTKKSKRWIMPHYFFTHRFTLKDGSVVRIVVLDTSPFEKTYYSDASFKNKFTDTTRQKIWMDSVFALKDADWTIVSGHHPLYTGGSRVAEKNSVRSSLLPIFTKYKLPVYFAGHEHDLQHLKPFDLPVNQFVLGAGSELRPTGAMAYTKFSASVQGFMSVEVTRNVLNVFVINYKKDTLYRTVLTK